MYREDFSRKEEQVEIEGVNQKMIAIEQELKDVVSHVRDMKKLNVETSTLLSKVEKKVNLLRELVDFRNE